MRDLDARGSHPQSSQHFALLHHQILPVLGLDTTPGKSIRTPASSLFAATFIDGPPGRGIMSHLSSRSPTLLPADWHRSIVRGAGTSYIKLLKPPSWTDTVASTNTRNTRRARTCGPALFVQDLPIRELATAPIRAESASTIRLHRRQSRDRQSIFSVQHQHDEPAGDGVSGVSANGGNPHPQPRHCPRREHERRRSISTRFVINDWYLRPAKCDNGDLDTPPMQLQYYEPTVRTATTASTTTAFLFRFAFPLGYGYRRAPGRRRAHIQSMDGIYRHRRILRVVGGTRRRILTFFL